MLPPKLNPSQDRRLAYATRQATIGRTDLQLLDTWGLSC